MITDKGFNVFVAIFVIVSFKACLGCFSENSYENIPIKTGTGFVKSCHCEMNGYSVQHIKWIDPSGKEIEPLGPGTNSKVYTNTNARDGYVNLHIGSMSISMSGPYICETDFEGNKYNHTYNVEAYDSLYFVNTNTSQYVIVGEDSLISCEARGNILYPMLVTWHFSKDNKTETQINSDDKYDIIPNGLIVKNASTDDGGTYKCTATDPGLGDIIDRIITVQVTARPVISELKASPGAVVIAGSELSVQCVAEGIPHPKYFWKKVSDSQGNQLQDQNGTWQQKVDTLLFKSIEKDDAGTYSCLTTNLVGSATSNITIEVNVWPEITEIYNVTAVEGSAAQIVCKATGEPKPDIIVIYSEEESLQNDARITYEEKKNDNESELLVSFLNVNRSYEGVYTCNASNLVGSVSQDMYFTVYYKPFFVEPFETIWGWDGKIVNMSCDHKSNPPSNIEWRFQGNNIEQQITTATQVKINKLILELRDNVSENSLILPVDNETAYGVYECIAKNNFGEAKKTVHLRQALPPAAIKNVTDINKTATSITFHIEGPENSDGPPVLGYVAQYDTMDDYNVTNIHPTRTWGLDRKFTIERLKPNSTYFVKFAAKNEAGDGLWSNTYTFDTPQTSVPEPPSWDDGQPGNLRWKSPEDNGNPIDHYIIEYCPFHDKVINHSLCKEEKLTATEFPLDSLDRSRTYSFKIRAHNSHGYSEYVDKELTTPEQLVGMPAMSAAAIIGISVAVVIFCLLLLDLLLLCWRRQGIIASFFMKKSKNVNEPNLQSRDKKGLLAKEGESRPDGSLTSANNGHREFEYNKTTGVITGKHSTV